MIGTAGKQVFERIVIQGNKAFRVLLGCRSNDKNYTGVKLSIFLLSLFIFLSA